MSEVRQAVQNKDANKRQTVNFTNAAGDIISKKDTTHQKGKNTIPKNLRYDLENALVGLCDVWFEEIKPYLVRNNIKVHVDAGGDLKRSPAPDCSHVDPGRSDRLRQACASYVDSSSMRRTASRAPCRKPPAQLPLVLSRNQIAMQLQRNNGRKETVRKSRKRRKSNTQVQRTLIPRLCRTYSKQQCSGVNATIEPAIKLPLRNSPKHSHHKKKIHTKDAATQTEKPIKDLKKSYTVIANNPKVSNFARCSATTNILLPKQNKNRTDTSFLFKDDLVDIIAEKHDKMLKVLYTSPRKEEHPSVMNLFSPSEDRRKPKIHARIPPWK